MNIPEWFDANHDDGEFVVCGRETPYEVVPPPNAGATIVYATKPPFLFSQIERGDALSRIGIVARPGLPNPADIQWLHNTSRRHPMIFLGDLDPPDLMIFYWLRQSLFPNPVAYFGISDTLLRTLMLGFPAQYAQHMTPREARAWNVLRSGVPDLDTIIGHSCMKLLTQGMKLELEALVACNANIAAAIGHS